MVESKTVTGTNYKVVTFTLPGGHTLVGYINDQDVIERVETTIGDKNDVRIEALYRDYADFDGVKFPMLIIEKQAAELSLILVAKDVKSVKVDLAPDIPASFFRPARKQFNQKHPISALFL